MRSFDRKFNAFLLIREDRANYLFVINELIRGAEDQILGLMEPPWRNISGQEEIVD